MKKTFTILMITYCGYVMAQPTINSTVFPVPGNSITYINVDPASLSPGNAGANQTWNFSAVTPTAPAQTINHVLPASTPYSASHPGSTVCEVIPNGAGNFAYTYYVSNSSVTNLKGISFISSGNTINFIYTNTQKVLEYPFNYNSSFTDNFVASYTLVSTGITITNYRTGTETVTYDGYGTLQLPSATTFNNVARVKIIQDITDSAVYTGVPLPPIINNFSGTTHNWIATGVNGKLAQFTLSFDTTVSSQNPTTYNSYARYQTASTGLMETGAPVNVLASPNPASDFTTLTINNAANGIAELTVTDMNGRLVRKVDLNFIHPDNNHIQVDMSDFAQGIYNLKVTQEQNIWNSKVVRY
jgi:hypothetical protein